MFMECQVIYLFNGIFMKITIWQTFVEHLFVNGIVLDARNAKKSWCTLSSQSLIFSQLVKVNKNERK